MKNYKHTPVMLNEAIHYLNCQPGKIYVDCTLGGAGHTQAILKKILPTGMLLAMDQDKDAIANAENILSPYKENIRIFHGNFIYLPEFLSELNIKSVDGILIDLGISFYQIDASGRGFSFNKDEPLDMRMNLDTDMTAEDLINESDEDNLAKIFKEYGEERWSKRIARRIAEKRKKSAIRTSRELAQIVCEAIPGGAARQQRIHPATRVFMAVRIAVNKELERLSEFIDNIVAKDNGAILNPNGRLCIISFHSLEDRIVKQGLKFLESGCICPPNFPICVCNKKKIVNILTRKAIQPTQEEIEANPMARSAKLRVAEKIQGDE